MRVKILTEKDVYERYLRHPDLANLSSEENATGASMLGVLYPVHNISCEQLSQYFTAWAIELLILSKAMREPGCGISE